MPTKFNSGSEKCGSNCLFMSDGLSIFDLKTLTLNSLEEKIAIGIAEIAAIGDRLPGVVVVHDLRDWTVAWMSTNGLEQIGTTLEELTGKTMDTYHSQFFNPEDAKDYLPRLMQWLERNDQNETLSYFQQVRIHGSQNWTWHMSSARIYLRDEDGTPLLAVSISSAIDAMHHMAAKAEKLLQENNFLRRNLSLFLKLSRREKEVLRLMALGKSAPETAEQLFIALNTVESHRKNIKQKLCTSSFYELATYARAFDLI